MTTTEVNNYELALIGGDLSKLSAQERLSYYKNVCESLKLNPLTKPFAYIQLNGKLTLYALKDCTEQLRKINKVSISKIEKIDIGEGICAFRATATSGIDNRTDESIGAVSVANLKGENLANAVMKAETKAKRRVTLSICGLGMLDETEADTIADAKTFHVDDFPVEPKKTPLHFYNIPDITFEQRTFLEKRGCKLDTQTGYWVSEKELPSEKLAAFKVQLPAVIEEDKNATV